MNETVTVEDAFVGNAVLAIGSEDSPITFTDWCAVTDMGSIGVKNDQVEVTTFCNGGAKHYIPGLSDGVEITIKANYVTTAGDDLTNQESLMDSVDAKENRHFRLTIGIDSPFKTFSFQAAMLGYALSPAIAKQNEITFTAKISGPVVRT
jgi:hypothetical protein